MVVTDTDDEAGATSSSSSSLTVNTPAASSGHESAGEDATEGVAAHALRLTGGEPHGEQRVAAPSAVERTPAKTAALDDSGADARAPLTKRAPEPSAGGAPPAAKRPKRSAPAARDDAERAPPHPRAQQSGAEVRDGERPAPPGAESAAGRASSAHDDGASARLRLRLECVELLRQLCKLRSSGADDDAAESDPDYAQVAAMLDETHDAAELRACLALLRERVEEETWFNVQLTLIRGCVVVVHRVAQSFFQRLFGDMWARDGDERAWLSGFLQTLSAELRANHNLETRNVRAQIRRALRRHRDSRKRRYAEAGADGGAARPGGALRHYSRSVLVTIIASYVKHFLRDVLRLAAPGVDDEEVAAAPAAVPSTARRADAPPTRRAAAPRPAFGVGDLLNLGMGLLRPAAEAAGVGGGAAAPAAQLLNLFMNAGGARGG